MTQFVNRELPLTVFHTTQRCINSLPSICYLPECNFYTCEILHSEPFLSILFDNIRCISMPVPHLRMLYAQPYYHSNLLLFKCHRIIKQIIL